MSKKQVAGTLWLLLAILPLAAGAQEPLPGAAPGAGNPAGPGGPVPAPGALDSNFFPPAQLGGGYPGEGAYCPPVPGPLYADQAPTRQRLGSVYARMESVWYMRNRGYESQPVVLDGNNVPATTVLNTTNMNFDMVAAPRIVLGAELPNAMAVEASYLGWYWNNATNEVVGANNLLLPGDVGLALPEFNALDRVDIQYLTQLQDFEINIFEPKTGPFTYLLGVRYLGYDETYKLTATNSNLPNTVNEYSVATSNNLLGGQFGLRFNESLGDMLKFERAIDFDFLDLIILDSTIKLGGFSDAAKQHQVIQDVPSTLILRDASSNSYQPIFMAEFNANVIVVLGPCASVRLGYNLFYLDGLALAPNNLDFTNDVDSGTTTVTKGSVLLHGPSAGLQFTF